MINWFRRHAESVPLARRLRIAKLQKLAFGKSSEKIEREIEQLELALEDLLVAVAEGDDDLIDKGMMNHHQTLPMRPLCAVGHVSQMRPRANATNWTLVVAARTVAVICA